MKYYPIVVEQTENNFSAYVPDLPGCVALGDTLEEVHRLVQEGIQIYIECLEEDGLPIPEPYSKMPVPMARKKVA